MIREQDVILLGTCTRTHGKQGEVQVVAERDFLDEANAPSFVIFSLDNILTPFHLLDWREKGADAYILSLEGMDSEEKARRLCERKVYLLRKDLTDDPEQELLTWGDLIGYEVLSAQGTRLGVIKDVDETTINTLFMLDNGAIVPAHEDLVTEIDSSEQRLYMDLPEGLEIL